MKRSDLYTQGMDVIYVVRNGSAPAGAIYVSNLNKLTGCVKKMNSKRKRGNKYSRVLPYNIWPFSVYSQLFLIYFTWSGYVFAPDKGGRGYLHIQRMVMKPI